MIPSLCSLCVERLCGKKSSAGGIRQLFLQWLWQWRRRPQEAVQTQRDVHHGDHHHRCRQRDHPAHRGHQKREGSLQQVQTSAVFILSLTVVSSVYSRRASFPLPKLPVQNSCYILSLFLSDIILLLCVPSSVASLDFRVFRPALRRYVVLEGPARVQCSHDSVQKNPNLTL